MDNIETFTIDYKFHEKPRTFLIRAKTMSNLIAWHWASCDAGVAPIPKPGKPPLKVFSKPMAERYGITDVCWRGPARLEWPENHES